MILIVEGTLQNERKADLDRFKTAMQAAPEVLQRYMQGHHSRYSPSD
ncbi:hypothetical protein [Roseinatronobacter bogoriensis]|nr:MULTISPECIES: hypothetical protein [Rhodobaca]